MLKVVFLAVWWTEVQHALSFSSAVGLRTFSWVTFLSVELLNAPLCSNAGGNCVCLIFGAVKVEYRGNLGLFYWNLLLVVGEIKAVSVECEWEQLELDDGEMKLRLWIWGKLQIVVMILCRFITAIDDSHINQNHINKKSQLVFDWSKQVSTWSLLFVLQSHQWNFSQLHRAHQHLDVTPWQYFVIECTQIDANSLG